MDRHHVGPHLGRRQDRLDRIGKTTTRCPGVTTHDGTIILHTNEDGPALRVRERHHLSVDVITQRAFELNMLILSCPKEFEERVEVHDIVKDCKA